MASAKLTQLNRFKNLKTNTKRQLYLSLFRSQLTYPIIPLHLATKSNMTTMQKIQNRATRFITNTKLSDRITSQTLHEQTQLLPINMFLHNSAINIWNTIEENLGTEHMQAITTEAQYKYTYPSSYNKSIGPAPEPIFT